MLLGDLEADEGELGIDPKDEIAHVAQESPNSAGSALDYVMDGDDALRRTQAAIAAAEQDDSSAEMHVLYEEMEAIDGFSAEARAARLLHGLGFASDTNQKSVREFSGGWRMRLNLARALMCRSDILLLDEPTNHLDLPAILWLERWLKRYEGILLVISHDRHLLRSVCDELLIVHDGVVDRFSQTLDEYPAWLKEQQTNGISTDGSYDENAAPRKHASRKQIRQQEAQRRQRLKPLYDQVRKIDTQLATARTDLEALQKRLAEEDIYRDPERKTELAELVKDQASLKSELDALEWRWMEASEALELAN